MEARSLNSNLGRLIRKFSMRGNKEFKMHIASQVRRVAVRSVQHLDETRIEGVKPHPKKQRFRRPNKWSDSKIESIYLFISKYSMTNMFSNQASNQVWTQRRATNIARVGRATSHSLARYIRENQITWSSQISIMRTHPSSLISRGKIYVRQSYGLTKS